MRENGQCEFAAGYLAERLNKKMKGRYFVEDLILLFNYVEQS